MPKSLEVDAMIKPNIETLLIAGADTFPNNDTLKMEQIDYAGIANFIRDNF